MYSLRHLYIIIGFSKLKKCFKYLLKEKETTPKKYYINKWRKYLSKEANTTKELNDPFELLTRLWAHKNVIHELEDIRLNPNLLNKKQIRNDLEFYIPQLCSFMLFGEYEIVQELFSFLCKSCYVSFSFAHRLMWFTKSSVGEDPKFNDRIRKILSIIQTIFKSNSDKEKEIVEELFLSGSRDYISYYQSQSYKKEYLIANHHNMISEDENDQQKKDFDQSKISFCTIRDNYVDNQYHEVMLRYGGTTSNEESSSINNDKSFEIDSKMIYLTLFKKYDFVTNDENTIHTQCTKQIDLEDVNLSSFLSNLHFIDQLCNISDILMNTELSEQKKTLIKELRRVNKNLPSNVYLPFLSNSMRNYVVSSIPISEARIFKTKQRAPYMITVECFRLDELTYNLLNDCTVDNPLDGDDCIYQNVVDTEYDSRKTGSENHNELITVNNIIKEEKDNDKDIGIYSVGFLKNQSDFDIDSSPQKQDDNMPKPSSMTPDEIAEINKKSSKSLALYLLENEVKFSKPLIIHNLIRRTGQSYNSSNTKSKTPSKSQSASMIIHVKKGNEKSHPISNNYNQIKENENESINDAFNNKTNNENISATKCAQIDSTIKSNFNSKQEYIDIDIDNNINGDNQMITITKTQRNKSIDLTQQTSLSPNNQQNLIEDNDDSKSDEEKDKENNLESLNEYTITNSQGNIFGETLEQKTERLRKISPFGKLTSYKLFDIIVKSGEDLRQEQFATQLINEFLQIFKFEKTKCWLHPYEILATGTDVGIVEVVPNAISLDQLKHKNNSLKEFYDTHFGQIGSIQHKTAMKNYLRSLAGYSLVCYFLQIKDRHNANILIDEKGHLIHIDFGFMLSNSPGKGIKFEKAPFKLTQDFVDVMGGTNSAYFDTFRKLLWKGFIALVQHYEKILILVEMMYCGHCNKLPCFENGQNTIDELRKRFVPRANMKNRDYIAHVDELISQSLDNWRTKWYDKYQYYVQGILA